MRMVCLSRNNDIATGLRLAGVQSFVIYDLDKMRNKLIELAKDAEIGIISVTEDIYEILKNDIEKISNNQDFPLIVSIPNSK